jgi:hypothetical protein
MQCAASSVRSHTTCRGRSGGGSFLRSIQAAVALLAVAFAAFSPNTFDCNAAYKGVLLRLLDAHDVNPSRLAALNRQALRVHDACITGDLNDPSALFARLHASLDAAREPINSLPEGL